jgi:hypothetical protein
MNVGGYLQFTIWQSPLGGPVWTDCGKEKTPVVQSLYWLNCSAKSDEKSPFHFKFLLRHTRPDMMRKRHFRYKTNVIR